MKLVFFLTFLCCVVVCLSETEYEDKCYTLLYCDGGSSDSEFIEQTFSKRVNSSEIEHEGCSKRQIELDIGGWKKTLKSDNVYVKGETYKNLKRVDQWIFRCDDHNDGDGKGKVKVGDKSCKTNINAMLFEVCWKVKKD